MQERHPYVSSFLTHERFHDSHNFLALAQRSLKRASRKDAVMYVSLSMNLVNLFSTEAERACISKVPLRSFIDASLHVRRSTQTGRWLILQLRVGRSFLKRPQHLTYLGQVLRSYAVSLTVSRVFNFSRSTFNTDLIMTSWEFQRVAPGGCRCFSEASASVPLTDLCTYATIFDAVLSTRVVCCPAFCRTSLTHKLIVCSVVGSSS